MKKWMVATLVLALFAAAGCMERTRVADLTFVSSKNISTLEGAQRMGVFEGKHCRSAMGGQLPNQEEAIDMALEAGKGNAMVDCVIYYKPANCVFDTQCWEVKGTVIKTKDLLSSENLEKGLMIQDSTHVLSEVNSVNGKKYYMYQKKDALELNNDEKHYDAIIRAE